jgi:hypothetical protein
MYTDMLWQVMLWHKRLFEEKDGTQIKLALAVPVT